MSLESTGQVKKATGYPVAFFLSAFQASCLRVGLSGFVTESCSISLLAKKKHTWVSLINERGKYWTSQESRWLSGGFLF